MSEVLTHGGETAARAAASRKAPEPGLALDEPGLFAPLYPLPRPELVSARGARVTDAAGRELLDFVSGIAVHALGHAPKGLARAVSRQMATLDHTSNLYANRPAIELARRLTELTGYERVFFCNSGTEGVEAALKFARARAHALDQPGRDIVAFTGGFHGRTGFALSATFHPPYRAPFEPLVPGVRFLPFNDPTALDEAAFATACAVIVEPVQGEAGAIPARSDFLQALRERCDAANALLVFDEIQSGMGRTGRFLAAEHSGVRADVTVLSKALGGGLPLGAVLLNARASEGLAPGMHGTTFGGNAVAAAAGLWMLERVADDKLLARVRARGARLLKALRALVTRHASLAEARGLGLLTAVELAPAAPFDPPALVRAARDHGLLIVRGGERAVRLLPPLTVTNAELDEAVQKLEAAVTSLETASAAPVSAEEAAR
jgi:predicted acetylornithine/succinylornithine family transaminase